MALHDCSMAEHRVRASAASFRALGRANAATQSGPAEYWSGRLERAVAARANRGTTFSDPAYFSTGHSDAIAIDFVSVEEDTSGW